MHDHQPSGKWDEIKKEPNSDFLVKLNVTFKSPSEAADAARYWELENRPLAALHFDHYRTGAGQDYVEDRHLADMMQTDEGVMYKVGRDILSKRGPTSTVVTSFLEIRQDRDYLNEEFEYAFGSIDRMDYEADFQKKSLRVWFKDRYEWHPYYPKIYPVIGGDVPRGSNVLHAAMVELKTEGASDFWMIGKAEVPLDPVLQIASRDRPPSRGAIGGDSRSEGSERTSI
jgi:hypothetical protein